LRVLKTSVFGTLRLLFVRPIESVICGWVFAGFSESAECGVETNNVSPLTIVVRSVLSGAPEDNLRSIIRMRVKYQTDFRKDGRGDSILEFFEKWLQGWRNLWGAVNALWL
jgi:hypothetical protein